MSNPIRVGIGGWSFPPWRGTFYPEKWPQKRELDYASRHVTAIEINATYHRLQKPASFAAWAATAPEGFVFAVKASRYCTNRRVLGEAGESIATFLAQGLVELGDKLGPILWQLPATKAFDAGDVAAFLQLLPARHGGVALRHALEVGHHSFRDPAFATLARDAGVAIAWLDAAERPLIAEPTAPFVYARLKRAEERYVAGYAPAHLDTLAATARAWSAGDTPPDSPPALLDSPGAPRDVFLFFINGYKVKAPAAAMALIERLGDSG